MRYLELFTSAIPEAVETPPTLALVRHSCISLTKGSFHVKATPKEQALIEKTKNKKISMGPKKQNMTISTLTHEDKHGSKKKKT